MPPISAADVKSLRERTGLPMMDCKEALQEAKGDQELAVEILRKKGMQVFAKRSDRDTSFGRMGIFASIEKRVGAMVEVKCESPSVAANEEFIRFANAVAEQLATGPGANTVDELLDQPSPVQPGSTLRQQKEDLFNRTREVVNIGRFTRFDGPCGGYSHNASTISGVLTEVSGGNAESVKDVCMHIAAMRPQALTVEELPPDVVAKEREILREAARQEGKPENILDKMVEGRMRNFFAQSVLLEQPFVKEQKITVGQYAQQNGFNIKRYELWELGKA